MCRGCLRLKSAGRRSEVKKSLTAAFVAVALIIVEMAVAPSAQAQDKATVPAEGDPI